MYSVIIPAHEDVPYLAQAVQSVLDQSEKTREILVVFNGVDKDFSMAISTLRPYMAFLEIHVIPEEGIAPALNFGISRATSRFISFLDSDDLWEKDKQEKQIAMLNQDPSLDAVSGLIIKFTDTSVNSRLLGSVEQGAVFPATTFRRETFDRFGNVDATATHFQWLYRWWNHARMREIACGALDSSVLLRRVHSNNGWVTQRDEGTRQLFAELRAMSRTKRAVGS